MWRVSGFFREWGRFIFPSEAWVERLLQYGGVGAVMLAGWKIVDVFQQPAAAILSSPWVTYAFDHLNVGWVVVLFVLGLWLLIGVGVAWERSKKPRVKVAKELKVDPESGIYRWLIKTDAGMAEDMEVSVTKVIFWNGEPYFPATARLPLKLQWMHHPRKDTLTIRELGARIDVMQVVLQEGEPPYLLLMGAQHQQEIEQRVSLDDKRKIYCLLNVSSPNCQSIEKWISFSPLGDTFPYYKATIESLSSTFRKTSPQKKGTTHEQG